MENNLEQFKKDLSSAIDNNIVAHNLEMFDDFAIELMLQAQALVKMKYTLVEVINVFKK